MNKKQVVVVTDITFDNIMLKISSEIFNITKVYYGDVASILFSIMGATVDADVILIHTDPYFNKYNNAELDNIVNSISAFAKIFKGTICISNLISVFPASNLSNSYGNFIPHTDENLFFKLIRDFNNIQPFDFHAIITKIGINNAYDYRLGFLYQMPYTKSVINSFAEYFIQYFEFYFEEEKKVIILDCDNTLWKGVLGEDGIENIKCDKNKEGILFYHFQKFLLEKKQEGFLLCLCSKNNESDVKQAFDQLNMPTKWTDFIVRKINWQPKYLNIKEIADELNLGINSFIFIDDSSFEIKSICDILPEVSCFEFKHDYSYFIDLIDHFSFKKKNISKEDSKKTTQYIEEQKRLEFKDEFSSFNEYIKSLEIKNVISINELENMTRLAQLTEKTNQFNFNKEVFSAKNLEDYISSGNIVFSIKSNDKFGDYGIIGLILVDVINQNATIRNYLLSCRALGRNIEYEFWNYVLNYLTEKNLNLGKILFVNTPKNKPALDFYNIITKQ